MAADTLLKAIKNKWYNSSELTTLVTGGLFLSQIPDKLDDERVDLPAAYVTTGRSKYIWTFTTLSGEVTDVEFVIFVPGSGVSTEQVTDAVRSVFDWCTLTFENPMLKNVYFQPIDGGITCEPLRYRDGSMVYRTSLAYESLINRTLLHYP